ncbi:MAG: type I DNA topoisomerase [Gammaproteobacteria bacterium]
MTQAKKPAKTAAANLVIVESPAKAKTIKKYLGKDFLVMASYGHMRDLLPKKGAVDPDAGFLMHYEIIEKNAPHVDAICAALKKASSLYLATDPDREGEAIAWHILEILQERKALKNKSVHRVVFHEITKNAVKNAVEHPRTIDMNLVNAQQARRALDYLVGFNLSPLLWKKVRRGLSAGRVQSPALRLIVEREEEIEAFKSQEYWTIAAACNFKKQAFDAKLIEYQGEKVEQFTIVNEKQAAKAKQTLLKAADGKLQVSKVDKKTRKRNPAAPFITSTLQQEAARKLGFSAKRTMQTAQRLYEAGLITYMRTDSVNLAQEAIVEIREVITEKFGEDNLPKEPRVYKTKSKNAQEAHEAIRPTSASSTPESMKKTVPIEQYKLYNLIWKRTVASQMVHATLDTVAVDLRCGKKHGFRANGSTIVHPGFMAVYLEGNDDKKSKDQDDSKDRILPPLQEGDEVKLNDVITDQHFTEPPPRYSEASLVKALEERGIGRPSTYASIISTLISREYAILDQKRFHPTDVGRIVSKFLAKYFGTYVDYDFTAKMEDDLDAISRGEEVWIPLLESFWTVFKERVDHIDETVQRKDVTQEELDEVCPKCGKKLSIRLGRAGRFIGCTGYPECDYTRSLEGEEEAEPEVVEGRTCPKCGSPLIIRHGRYGKFIGCSGYPKCKYIEPLEKPKDTGVTCPECKKGTMLQRKSRYGKVFYSCSRYPDCKYAVWNEPIAEKCPKCGWPILTIKVTKRRGKEKVCPQKDCDYVKKVKD